MHTTRTRERMCAVGMLTLRHARKQVGLHIKQSLEFSDLRVHTNSNRPTMVVKSPSVKFYQNPLSRLPVIIRVKTDRQTERQTACHYTVHYNSQIPNVFLQRNFK
jgi:hypothetical protein